jgi:capsular polysaccharide biosynthesis protein
MTTSESPRAHSSGGFSPAQGPLPESDPFFIRDRSTAKSPETKAHGVLRRLAGRWLQILMLWLLISFVVTLLVHALVKPTYVAVSLLRVEPPDPDIFGPLERLSDDSRNLNNLQTQVNVITSNAVLEPALANPAVANLPVIKRAEDPRSDLREKLKVEIIGDTNLIRIALELADRNEAVAIVRAVTDACISQSVDFGRLENRFRTEAYERQLVKISKDIDSRKQILNDLIKQQKALAIIPLGMLNPKTETDPTQPTLNKVTEEQFAKLIDKQVQCDLDYLDAVAQFEAVKAVRERNEDKIDEELKSRVAEVFKKDPQVGGLMDQMREARELAKSEDQVPTPTTLSARARLAKLSKDYEELWASESRRIHARLAVEDDGPLSDARIRELEVAVEKARRKKESFAKQVEQVEVIRAQVDQNSFDFTHVNYQLESLMRWENQVRKNLEQLKDMAAHQRNRVRILEEASASKSPKSDMRMRYMAAVTGAVLLLLVGSFLAHEIRAYKRAATLLV